MGLLLWACVAPENESAPSSDLVDHRQDPGTPPADGFQEKTTEYILEPHSEIMYCYFGTYTGPDAGAVYYEWFQDPMFGHHFMTLAVEDDVEVEDGTVVDCTDPSVSAMSMPPLLQGTELVEAPNGRMNLPEGVAIELKSGQRWALQSHYVNSSDDRVLVQDAINVRLVPHEEVETWASTYVANSSHFVLPTGRQAMDLSCVWPEPMNFLNILGHMHESGRNIYAYHEHGDQKDLLYSVEGWDPALIYGPIVKNFTEDHPFIDAGDKISVRCEYDNLTGDSLEFPHEMCVAAGLAWPLQYPYQCDEPATVSTW